MEERNQRPAVGVGEGQEQAAKITAQTDKEAAAIVANATKEAEIIKGKGDKEAMRIYAEAYGKDMDYFDFIKSLEVCKEILKNKSTLILSTQVDILKYLESDQIPSIQPFGQHRQAGDNK